MLNQPGWLPPRLHRPLVEQGDLISPTVPTPLSLPREQFEVRPEDQPFDALPALLIDFRLHEPCQVSQRLLPPEVARLHRNDVRQAFLHDVELRADRNFLQRHRHHDLAGEVRIVELVSIAQALVRNELDVFPAERMADAGLVSIVQRCTAGWRSVDGEVGEH